MRRLQEQLFKVGFSLRIGEEFHMINSAHVPISPLGARPMPISPVMAVGVRQSLVGLWGRQDSRAELKVDQRLDLYKLAADVLFLFARRLQGKEMKLRPYEREKEPSRLVREVVHHTGEILRRSLRMRGAGRAVVED